LFFDQEQPAGLRAGKACWGNYLRSLEPCLCHSVLLHWVSWWIDMHGYPYRNQRICCVLLLVLHACKWHICMCRTWVNCSYLSLVVRTCNAHVQHACDLCIQFTCMQHSC